MSDQNNTAHKKHALACSEACKRGKFTRVGADFVSEVEADVEAIVRKFRNEVPLTQSAVPTDETFVTGALAEKLKEALNEIVARVIQNKMCRQPSVGVTAGRTR
jgi:hypothetical protein